MLVCNVVSAVSLSDSFWSTSPCNVFKAVVLASLVAVILASTYVFTAFTLGYLSFDVSSTEILVLLLIKSSLVASADMARSTSVCKFVVKVLSARILFDFSVFKFEAIVVSALVALKVSSVIKPAASVMPAVAASTYIFTAFSVGKFTSEFPDKVPSVLLFAVFSLVPSAANARVLSVTIAVAFVFSTPLALVSSAVIALVKVRSSAALVVASLVRFVASVPSAVSALVFSVAIAVAFTPSAVVALVVSKARLSVKTFSAAEALVISAFKSVVAAVVLAST